MFHRSPEKYLYHTRNIIEGTAELPHVMHPKRKGWVIPGGHVLTNKADAVAYAKRMNNLMVANMPFYKRKRL